MFIYGNINETSGQQWNTFVFIAINKHIDQKAHDSYVSKTKNILLFFPLPHILDQKRK